MSAAPLRIDFVSDVACPWCVIGLRSLLQALEMTGVAAELHFQPFELNPDMVPEGENTGEPSVIFNGKWLIQGGQPPEVFADAIRNIVAGTATEAAQ